MIVLRRMDCVLESTKDAFTQILKKNKIEYENRAGEKMKITNRVDGVKQIYFKDSYGYWIEINDAKE